MLYVVQKRGPWFMALPSVSLMNWIPDVREFVEHHAVLSVMLKCKAMYFWT